MKAFLKRFFFLILLCPLVACRAQTPDLLPTATAPELSATALVSPVWFPATATPAPSPQPSPAGNTILPPTKGQLILDGVFATPESWLGSNGEAGYAHIQQSSLTMALPGGAGRAQSLSVYKLPDEFYLEVNIETGMCSSGDRYGILFWEGSTAGNYRLWINCEGQMRLERELPERVDLYRDWQVARKFQAGSPAINRIGIWARKGEVLFFVNDCWQFSQAVNADLRGGLGILAQTGGDYALTVSFSELRVYSVVENGS